MAALPSSLGVITGVASLGDLYCSNFFKKA